MKMPNTLSVNNLSCQRGEQILFQNLQLCVESGDILQVRGLNGSGKTSLLRLIAGLGLIHEGEILWNAASIHSIRETYSSQLTYLGHKLGLKNDLTAVENLRTLLGAQPQEIHHALADVGLADKHDLLLRDLSAGQKRRVVLAKLVMNPTPLWILDEPFTGLDQEGVQFLAELMEQHRLKGGMIIFTSHQDVPLQHRPKELYLS